MGTMIVKKKIDRFNGGYRFLSNFWPCEVMYDGIPYPSVEHAYQAAKTLDARERKYMIDMTAAGAKAYGKLVQLREDWDSIKDDLMLDLVRQKFYYGKNKNLKLWLLGTGDIPLIEGNHWGDTYWGVCDGEGENRLGKILMKVRDELREE